MVSLHCVPVRMKLSPRLSLLQPFCLIIKYFEAALLGIIQKSNSDLEVRTIPKQEFFQFFFLEYELNSMVQYYKYDTYSHMFIETR